jgi:hypothetical protein
VDIHLEEETIPATGGDESQRNLHAEDTETHTSEAHGYGDTTTELIVDEGST